MTAQLLIEREVASGVQHEAAALVAGLPAAGTGRSLRKVRLSGRLRLPASHALQTRPLAGVQKLGQATDKSYFVDLKSSG
jgi:hypothetical protein